jgi:hypothetical protein
MMITVMETLSSRSTRSFANSIIEARWPIPGEGTSTNSAFFILLKIRLQEIFVMRVEGNEFVVFRVGSLFIRVVILPTKFKDWKDTR